MSDYTRPTRDRAETRQTHVFWPILSMGFDMRGRLILRLFREGMIFRDVAQTLRISRECINWRIKNHPGFAEAVKEAREAGKVIRERAIWYRHPFRGMRPPTGKGHGGKPRFGVKRRG